MYRTPSGRGLRRPQLRRVRKTLAGRYYQLLPGHAPPVAVWDDGYEGMLVVRQRRAPVATPPLHQAPGVGPAGEEDVEGNREDM